MLYDVLRGTRFGSICCGAGKIISSTQMRTLVSRSKPDEVLGAARLAGRHRTDPKTVRATALEKLASQHMLFRSAGLGGLKTVRPSHFDIRLLFRLQCLSHKPQAPSLLRPTPDCAHLRTSLLTAT